MKLELSPNTDDTEYYTPWGIILPSGDRILQNKKYSRKLRGRHKKGQEASRSVKLTEVKITDSSEHLENQKINFREWECLRWNYKLHGFNKTPLLLPQNDWQQSLHMWSLPMPAHPQE